MACLLLAGGCKKQPPPPPEYGGASVEWRKLDTGFGNTSDPAVQAGVSMAKRALMYHQFPTAIVELDKLAGNPSLTEPQKKLVNDLLNQAKQAYSKSAPAPK